MERQHTRHADPVLESVIADLYERTIDVRHFAGKGYVLSATADKTPVGVPPGDDGKVLMADSTTTNGVKWEAVSGLAVDHGSLLGLADDDHTQYVLRSILTTNGDLFIRAAGIIARLAVGSAGQFLGVTAGLPAWQSTSYLDHGALAGLVDDDHPQYARYGRTFAFMGA